MEHSVVRFPIFKKFLPKSWKEEEQAENAKLAY